jgi:hypothetical protein
MIPAARDETLTLACPLINGAVAMGSPPLSNVTVPPGTPRPLDTTAVNDTACPYVDGWARAIAAR